MACLSYLVASPRQCLKPLKGAFDDVASAVGGAVVGHGRPPDEPMRLRWAFWSSGSGITLPMPRVLR